MLMNYIINMMILVLLLAGSCSGFGQDANSYRVLFLGNSVFYSRGGLCPSFEGFCNEAGLDYQAISQWNTPPNPQGVEFLNYGRIPLTLPEVAADNKIHALIRSGNFDFVILEGRRSGYLLPDWVVLTEDRGTHIPYRQNLEALSSLHSTIVQSGAQTVLYMHPGLHSNGDIKHPIAQIYQKLHADLEKMEINGRQHEVILVPALFLWIDAANRYGIDGWYTDVAHGNALARFSSACMLYTYLTGNDPRDNKFKKLTELTPSWEIIPEKTDIFVGDKDAKWIKDQVWLYYSTRPQ